MKPHEIRLKFLNFFKEHNHVIVESDSLVPSNDSTLLFTTAGMVQFKSLYAGAPLKFSTATTVQKCLRAGGKGSDLENVGKTLRHHTFFEMLGNFSFGDYFKQEAIDYALQFITQELKMDQNRLWVSVFEEDEDARELWIEAGFPAERIVKLGKEDNFWGPAGDEGACGPCSEIYYDLGEKYSCGSENCAVGCDCERYLEFWNLVFPQYYQEKNGDRKPLERKGVDTGMGLERLSFIMDKQANNNYETEIFKPIIKKISHIAQFPYNVSNASAYHVVADHVRTLTFALSDGILPSNEGRGYVIRRILRRALRFGKKLGLKKPFLHTLVGEVTSLMSCQYPELLKSLSMSEKIIKNEEKQFLSTLNKGLNLLDSNIEEIKQKGISVVDGDIIFKLYDTLGLPYEIIEEVVLENNLQMDKDGYDKLMKEQKKQGKQSWKGTAYTLDQIEKLLDVKIKETDFFGYDQMEINAEVKAIISDGQLVEKSQDEENIIVTDKTVFYAESGGQCSDIGEINAKNGKVKVNSVYKSLTGVYLHSAEMLTGEIKVGDKITLSVNCQNRTETAKNHTATHLLQFALREQLGDHVKQAGSYVCAERLRFDFSHTEKVSEVEIKAIEKIINQLIIKNINVSTQLLNIKETKKRTDILANFGEKYGETVRLVNIGGQSKELCGGTHISSTGLINGFKIINESSVSSGVRRIEAVTGTEFLKYASNQIDKLNEISKRTKLPVDLIAEKFEAHTLKIKQLEKKLSNASSSSNIQEEKILDYNKIIDGIEISVIGLKEVDGKHLLAMVDSFKQKTHPFILFAGSLKEQKISYVCASSEIPNFNCSDVLNNVAELSGGKGGGRSHMARGGGKKPEKFEVSMKKALELILQIVE